MGNCLVHQEKSVNVIRTDGKIIEYKSPIRVYQVLSEFPNHAISDKLPVVKHMHPNAELLQGHFYYLFPLPVVPQPTKKTKTKTKKTVRFADDVVIVEEEEEEKVRQSREVVRIKLVISKRELQEILSKEGVFVEDVISSVQNEQSTVKIVYT